MPADVSPLVVYYNPTLIDLTTVAEPGRNPVDQKDGWSLDEFGRAALQARGPGDARSLRPARPRSRSRRSSGPAAARSSTTPTSPTTLTLSEGASADALEKLLELVRDPALTFSQTALAQEVGARALRGGQARDDPRATAT